MMKRSEIDKPFTVRLKIQPAGHGTYHQKVVDRTYDVRALDAQGASKLARMKAHKEFPGSTIVAAGPVRELDH